MQTRQTRAGTAAVNLTKKKAIRIAQLSPQNEAFANTIDGCVVFLHENRRRRTRDTVRDTVLLTVTRTITRVTRCDDILPESDVQKGRSCTFPTGLVRPMYK